MSAIVVQPELALLPAPVRTRKSWLLFAVVNAISFGCLAWVMRGARFTEIWPEIRRMQWSLAAAAIVCDVVAYSTHAWRWQLLLTPIRRVAILQTGRAIYASLFVNEILPFRPGEAVRCLLLSRSSGLTLSLVCASALIERIFDGLWAVIGLIFCACMGGLPPIFQRSACLVGIAVAASAILLFLTLGGNLRFLPAFATRAPWVQMLLRNLQDIGHSRYLYYSFLASGVYLLAQFLPIYLLVRANHLPVSWIASAALIVFIRVSSALPQALGNVGAFQAVAARTLLFFGIASDHSKRFSFVLWAMVNLPLLCIGFAALAMEGFHLDQLRRTAVPDVNSGSHENSSDGMTVLAPICRS